MPLLIAAIVATAFVFLGILLEGRNRQASAFCFGFAFALGAAILFATNTGVDR
jgi:hypothetical protein